MSRTSQQLMMTNFDPPVDILGNVFPTLFISLLIAVAIFTLSIRHVTNISTPHLRGQPGYKKLGRVYDPLAEQAYECSQDYDGSRGSKARIQSLWIFPVKSCRGISLDEAIVKESGLEWDRRFMFVQSDGIAQSNEKSDELRWGHTTLRDYPKLALVETELWFPDEKEDDFMDESRSKEKGLLVLRWPSPVTGLRKIVANSLSLLTGLPCAKNKLVLPLFPESANKATSRVNVWKDSTPACLFEKELSTSLREFLGIKKSRFALALMSPGVVRPVYRNAPHFDEAGYQPEVKFQDSVSLQVNVLWHPLM